MNSPIDNSERFHNLLFGVRRSVRYHSRRVQFFDWIHKVTTLIVVLLGSTTIAVFGGIIAANWPLWVKLLPAVIASVLAAVELVWGVVQKAREHESLMRDFIAIERRMEARRDEPTPKFLTKINKRRLEIEANEPPVLRVLDTLCHNELMRAMGYDQSKQIEVGVFQRLFAHCFDFRQHTLHGPT